MLTKTQPITTIVSDDESSEALFVGSIAVALRKDFESAHRQLMRKIIPHRRVELFLLDSRHALTDHGKRVWADLSNCTIDYSDADDRVKSRICTLFGAQLDRLSLDFPGMVYRYDIERSNRAIDRTALRCQAAIDGHEHYCTVSYLKLTFTRAPKVKK